MLGFFGAPTTAPAQFGASTSIPTSTPSLFGSAPVLGQPSTGSNLFGTPSVTSQPGSGLFGTSTVSNTQASGGMFAPKVGILFILNCRRLWDISYGYSPRWYCRTFYRWNGRVVWTILWSEHFFHTWHVSTCSIWANGTHPWFNSLD